MSTMGVGEQLAHVHSKEADQWLILDLDHGDTMTEQCCLCRDFAADEARAHDQDPATVSANGRPEDLRIVDGPQRENTIRRRLCKPVSRARACRQHQTVKGQPLAIVEFKCARVQVETGSVRAKMPARVQAQGAGEGVVDAGAARG